jgi:hypothetical protein
MIMASSWDQGLPLLVLDHVDIHASSLTEGWKTFSTGYLLRSVLVMAETSLQGLPFDYQATRCMVQDLYDAFAATYGLAWVQDEPTGVTWFLPAGILYDRILATRVRAARDQLGLPMQSGILEPLETGAPRDVNVKRWSSLFQNTFNYAVDIPPGAYTVRDLLNLCCVANPTKTFLVQMGQSGALVTAVNLVPDRIAAVPAGALHLWDVAIDQGGGTDTPAHQRLMTKLADPHAEVRHAARSYLEAIISSVRVDDWLADGTSPAQTLWTCIGIASVLVRSEAATHQASIEIMKRLATDDFLAECEPALAMMTALELARLAKDARALDIVEKRKFGTIELAGVASDACRVAALSAYVREILQAKNADAVIGALRPLAAIVRSPTAGKLEFELVGSP